MTKRILIINPNSTASMTEDMVAIASKSAPTGVEVKGATNTSGPPSIQGETDAKASLPGLFSIAEGAEASWADAIVIGCFDDTGLEQLRARQQRPVVGLGEAGMIAATLAAPRFAILTTTQGSVPVISENVDGMGLGPKCDGVQAAHVQVLELNDRLPELRQALSRLALETETGAIVLGCAGMGRLVTDLASPGLPPLIDPVRAAVSFASAVVQCSFAHNDTHGGDLTATKNNRDIASI